MRFHCSNRLRFFALLRHLNDRHSFLGGTNSILNLKTTVRTPDHIQFDLVDAINVTDNRIVQNGDNYAMEVVFCDQLFDRSVSASLDPAARRSARLD
jgi:hypothetical protein